ncbi:hypothetical protein Q3G72_005216 [Acer saccharum]|nr:hypothetical protein Q3G72_005216 [Acer saccharum]
MEAEFRTSKQGNRFNKGIVGKNGSSNGSARRTDESGSPNISENNGPLGKNSGSGNVSARRNDGVGSSFGMGETEQMKSDAKVKKSNLGNSFSTVRITGSRFDILSDEGDVIMAEGSSQISNKSEKGRKNKGKVVLAEVTNQKKYAGEES